MTSLFNIFSGLDDSNKDKNTTIYKKPTNQKYNSSQTTSLSQGNRFIRYQNKIKQQTEPKIKYVNAREGFTPKLASQTKSVLSQYAPLTSGEGEQIFNSIDVPYSNTLGQVSGLVQNYNNQNTSYLARVNSSNPYLNTNVSFTTGEICYVTNQGVVKWYPNPDIYNSTAGSNGCPASSQVTALNIPWDPSYNTPGTTIPTTPNLITGTPMVSGQSCGNEGSNVFVNTMVGTNVSSNFEGCFNDNPETPAMTFLGGGPPPAANVIQNSNFSYPSISSNSYQYITSSTTVPGWNFNNGVLLNNSGAWGYPTPYPNGNQCVSIQMDSSISQVINLPSGLITLTFMACGRDCCDGSGQCNPVNISLNGNIIYNVANIGVNNWTSVTTTYTIPSSGEYTLTFQGTWTSGDRSTAFQDIQLIAGSTTEAGTYNQQTCQQAAEDGGYQYFALQNVNPATGMGYCAVSNNYVGATQYGTSTVTSGQTVLWQSNTTGTGNTATLNSSGSLSVINSSGASVFSTPVAGNAASSYLGCYGDGPNRAMTSSVLTNGQVVNANSGQYSWSFGVQQCQQAAQQNNASYFGLQDSSSEGQAVCFISDNLQQTQSYGPANNCTQFSDGTWQGGAWSNAVYSTGEGSNFWLQVTDAGLIAIYRGSSNTDNQGLIWSYQGSPGQANAAYAAENGLNGQNWISSGTSLASGDFIGSPSGVCALIMQSDGNLTFITFQTVSNCSAVNGFQAGGPGANAIYQLSEVGSQNNIGNVAYIDENGVLSPYPSSNVQLTADYTQIDNYDSPNSNIAGASFDNATSDSCQSACNNNEDCYGFSIINGVCYPKNNTVYPYGSRTPTPNSTLYVRGQAPTNPPQGVSSQVTNINSVQYQNYVPSGQPLSESYGLSSVTAQEEAALQSSQDSLNQLGQGVTLFTNLYNTANDAYNAQSTTNIQGIQDYVTDLNQTKKKIKNFDKKSNIDGILQNSDITVLQQNYSYMFWSILAIGTVIISMNISKK